MPMLYTYMGTYYTHGLGLVCSFLYTYYTHCIIIILLLLLLYTYVCMRFIKNEMIFYKLFVWSAMRWKILSEIMLTGVAAAAAMCIIRHIIII